MQAYGILMQLTQLKQMSFLGLICLVLALPSLFNSFMSDFLKSRQMYYDMPTYLELFSLANLDLKSLSSLEKYIYTDSFISLAFVIVCSLSVL